MGRAIYGAECCRVILGDPRRRTYLSNYNLVEMSDLDIAAARRRRFMRSSSWIVMRMTALIVQLEDDDIKINDNLYGRVNRLKLSIEQRVDELQRSLRKIIMAYGRLQDAKDCCIRRLRVISYFTPIDQAQGRADNRATRLNAIRYLRRQIQRLQSVLDDAPGLYNKFVDQKLRQHHNLSSAIALLAQLDTCRTQVEAAETREEILCNVSCQYSRLKMKFARATWRIGQLNELAHLISDTPAPEFSDSSEDDDSD